MEYEKWIKTLLSTYRYFDSMCRSIDKLVKKKCLNSNIISYYHTINDTYNSIDSMIQLNERKKNLIKLKMSIEKALSRLSVDDAKVLILYYFDGVSSKNIAILFNLSERTVLRRKAIAIERFKNRMFALGYSAEVLQSLFKDELWVQKQQYVRTYQQSKMDNVILKDSFENTENYYRLLSQFDFNKRISLLQ